MSTSVTFNGTSYAIPGVAELNWQALSSFLIDVGQHAALKTAKVSAVRVALTSPVTVSAASDYLIVTALSAPGAVAVNLPAGVDGQTFAIADGSGDAATHNITINPNGSDTIDGNASLVLSTNQSSVILQYRATGTDWIIVSQYPSITQVSSIGSSPNAAGASISGSALILQPADATHPGLVTTGTQTIAGAKTFSSGVILKASSPGNDAISYHTAKTNFGGTISIGNTGGSITVGPTPTSVLYNVIGNRCFYQGNIELTNSGASYYTVALPLTASATPVRQFFELPIIVFENSAFKVGSISLDTSVNATIFAVSPTATYTDTFASGVCIFNWNFSYLI